MIISLKSTKDPFHKRQWILLFSSGCVQKQQNLILTKNSIIRSYDPLMVHKLTTISRYNNTKRNYIHQGWWTGSKPNINLFKTHSSKLRIDISSFHNSWLFEDTTSPATRPHLPCLHSTLKESLLCYFKGHFEGMYSFPTHRLKVGPLGFYSVYCFNKTKRA